MSYRLEIIVNLKYGVFLMVGLMRDININKNGLIPRDKWDVSGIGDLVMATHCPVRYDTKLAIYDFIREFHVSDECVAMLGLMGDHMGSFTVESESFLLAVLEGTSHDSVKAAVIYSLFCGYFLIGQAIRSAELNGLGLADLYKMEGVEGSVNRIFLRNIRYWSDFTADEIEAKARGYIELADRFYRKEKIYNYTFNSEGDLQRNLVTVMGRKIDSLLYQLDNFCVGKPIKDCQFVTIEGEDINFQSRLNKVTLIDIWSSSCAPCKIKFPDLMELQRKYPDSLFEIITINVDRDISSLEDFVKSPEFIYVEDSSLDTFDDYLLPYIENPKMTLPIVYMGLTNPLLKKWGISAYPTLILLDKDGVVNSIGHNIPYDLIESLCARIVAKS